MRTRAVTGFKLDSLVPSSRAFRLLPPPSDLNEIGYIDYIVWFSAVDDDASPQEVSMTTLIPWEAGQQEGPSRGHGYHH